jgi:hypothetical protein
MLDLVYPMGPLGGCAAGRGRQVVVDNVEKVGSRKSWKI